MPDKTHPMLQPTREEVWEDGNFLDVQLAVMAVQNPSALSQEWEPLRREEQRLSTEWRAQLLYASIRRGSRQAVSCATGKG